MNGLPTSLGPTVVLVLAGVCTSAAAAPEASAPVRVTFHSDTGLPATLETQAHGRARGSGCGHRPRSWCARKPPEHRVRPGQGKASGAASIEAALEPLGLSLASHWAREGSWIVWDLDFRGACPRSGHAVQLDLPLLDPSLHVFTPDDRGVVDLSLLPTSQPAPYGLYEYFSKPNGRSYVLPLLSVFDPATNSALTVALPPDVNIPHLQVEWAEARTLRLTLAHRGMGGGKPSPLRILFGTHPADYRSTRPPMPAIPATSNPPCPGASSRGRFTTITF